MEDYKKYFSYDPESGHVTWRVKFGRKIRAGVRAGSRRGNGYRSISIYGKRISEHRLCFFLHTGRMPNGFIDHVNGDGSDNRWANLRECTHSENCQNIPSLPNSSKKSSRYRGVSWQESSKSWKAKIQYKKKAVHLGYFQSEDEAFEAYLKAKRELHSFNPVPRDIALNPSFYQ